MKLIKGGKKEPVVEKDHSNHWRVVVPNPDHPPLKPGEEGAFAFNNKKGRRKASEFKKEENEK